MTSTAYLVGLLEEHEGHLEIFALAVFSEPEPTTIINKQRKLIVVDQETGSTYEEAAKRLQERVARDYPWIAKKLSAR
jgi:hypothetical protein